MAVDGSLFRKSVFTTGEVAEICNVSQQTVIRCFDNGRLRGFRVPGSRFRRIPRDALIQFMKEHHIPLDRIDAGKKRVLIVDDDPAIVEMLVELLERDGRFEVETATTGFEAGIKTKQFSPDVIVLDFMLPDVNGNAVCRTIRSDPSMSGVRIIMVSGVVNPDDIERLKAEGADEFLQKPFNIEQLVNTITELVSG
jgi:excisionase family DNA binding protein